MPANNCFRHQVYSSDKPLASYRCVTADSSQLSRHDSLTLDRATVERLRAEAFDELILVHGTFTGDDALGLVRELSRVSLDTGSRLRESGKRWVDRLVGDNGNYSIQYETAVQQVFDGEQIKTHVQRFLWSGENHHLGRANAAVSLADRLLQLAEEGRSRIMLWGHSHAGNVFALLTHLMAGLPSEIDRFFEATSNWWRGQEDENVVAERWLRVYQRLSNRAEQCNPQLCLVTFGTPIRYGWESQGYDRLLHLVHHRPAPGIAEYLAPFPFTWDDLNLAKHGDYVQQLGIAGTDFLPYLFSWRGWSTEHQLHQLLEPEMRRRDVMGHLSAGQRVADEGTTLLIDYAPTETKIEQQLFGHGVYTRLEWMPYHLKLVVEHLEPHGGSSERS